MVPLRPLRGWTVGVSADRRAEEQIELLERRGARVVHGPAMRTVPLELDDRVVDAIHAAIAAPPEIVVLSTGIGTRALFDAAECLGVGDRLRVALVGAHIVARGPKAYGAAATAGLAVHWRAPGATSREVVAYLAAMGVRGRRVAVQLDGQDVPMLAQAIAELGADIAPLPVYRWTLPVDAAPAVRVIDAACARRLDALTFTSAPALGNLLDLAAHHEQVPALRAALNGPVAMVSIGVVCSGAARAAGIEPAVEPARHRLGAMVLALAEHAARVDAAEATNVGHHHVVVRATAVVVGDAVVELPPRERAALVTLLDRPGSVVAKERLLREAWDGEADGHAVEVTVGRLRRRLKGLLDIRSVPRRGYLVAAA